MRVRGLASDPARISNATIIEDLARRLQDWRPLTIEVSEFWVAPKAPVLLQDSAERPV